ncbi:MAG TPA: protein-glutamate O-methyltransferase CheR [Myxococcales bacterium]|nr:protein-glutamate O-methyltransferase CheR [Myxococcales bacterium]
MMVPLASLPALEERDFGVIRELAYRQAGLHFTDAKRVVVAARLQKRLRALALPGFGPYVRRLCEDEHEVQSMVEALCSLQTRFFRDPRQFELIEKVLCPAWMHAAAGGWRKRRVRALSAACSTGEEAFSIAMTLVHGLRKDRPWEIEVIAGDVSSLALARAERAEWSIDRARHVPQAYMREFMVQGAGPMAGVMRAAPSLRRLVQFVPLNLNDPAHLVSGRFDVVFCKNVLVHFDVGSRERAVCGLLPYLAPEGLLFVGRAESVVGYEDRLTPVIPSVYRHTAAA